MMNMVIPALKKKNPQNDEDELQGQSKAAQVAEKLSLADQKLAEPLIPVIGEELAKKLFSKHWNLRENVLETLVAELPKGQSSKVITSNDPWNTTIAIMGVISYTIADRINQVSTNAMNLLKALLSKKVEIGSKNELIPFIDNTLNGLLEKLGDSNPRIREQAENALMTMVRSPVVTCQFCLNAVVRDPPAVKGKNVQSAKHTLGRLRILQKIIGEFKINNNDVAYLPVVDYCVDKLENSNGEVRTAAVTLLVDIYKLVGEKLRTDLSSIRPSQMEMLEKELEKNGLVKKPAQNSNANKVKAEPLKLDNPALNDGPKLREKPNQKPPPNKKAK